MNDSKATGRRQNLLVLSMLLAVAVAFSLWSAWRLAAARAGPTPESYDIGSVFRESAEGLEDGGADTESKTVEDLVAALLYPPTNTVGERTTYRELHEIDGLVLLSIALDRNRTFRTRSFALDLLAMLCFGDAQLSSAVTNSASNLIELCLRDPNYKWVCLRLLRVACLGEPLESVLKSHGVEDASLLKAAQELPSDFEEGVAQFHIPGIDASTAPKTVEHNGRHWALKLFGDRD